MQVIHRLEDFIPRGSVSLSIGNFDGVHLGHQKILKNLVESCDQSVVMTFSNHPLEVLQGKAPSLICSVSHRLQLFKQAAVDTVILLPFTPSFAELPPALFLANLRQRVPFSKLVLGPDAAFGKGRSGNRAVVQTLAYKDGFSVEYMEALAVQGRPVSSSRVRNLITAGAFKQISLLLGRPFSFFGQVVKGAGRGHLLGFPTANLAVSGLSLPPYGVYRVSVSYQGKELRGVANLGLAPTFSQSKEPLLEVFIADFEEDLYGKNIEVSLEEYMRPERAFASIEELKEAIGRDVAEVLLVD